MIPIPPPYRKLLLVCTNERADGTACCAFQGSLEIHKKLKELMREKDPTIRVVKSGCLNQCTTGPNVVIVPEMKWFIRVSEKDLPSIVDIAMAA